MKYLIILISLILMPYTSWAQHTVFENLEETKEFDFMASREGYIQSDEGNWGYINLKIAHDFPNNVGADTYSFIIKYASKFEPNDFYLDPPQYIIHMVGPGQYRKIGYTEGMFFYHDHIAFMNEEDIDRFHSYIGLALDNHYREEHHAERALRRIFHEDNDGSKLPERKSLESAQRHFADIAKRYPFEARRDYNAGVIDEAEIDKDFYGDSSTYENHDVDVIDQDDKIISSDLKSEAPEAPPTTNSPSLNNSPKEMIPLEDKEKTEKTVTQNSSKISTTEVVNPEMQRNTTLHPTQKIATTQTPADVHLSKPGKTSWPYVYWPIAVFVIVIIILWGKKRLLSGSSSI